MKRFVVAVDCDGTLITKKSSSSSSIVANERIRTFLITWASFKFVTINKEKYKIHIVVWSGSGEMWAHQVVRELGITKYVNEIMAKNDDLKPDLVLDDVHACVLGGINAIVNEE